MKKLTVIMIFILGLALTIDLFAGNGPVDDFVNHHRYQEGVFHMDLGTSFLHGKDGDDDLLEKVDNLRIFSIDKEDGKVSGKEMNKFKKGLKKKGFDLYAKFKDSDTEVEFLALQKGKTITDWVMFVDGNESFFILEIQGRFDFDDLDKIGSKIEIGEAKYMKES